MKKILIIILVLHPFFGCSTGQKDSGSPLDSLLRQSKGEPVVPREANNILIQIIPNPVIDNFLHQKTAKEIKQAITDDGRLAVVYKAAQADLLLRVKIDTFEIQKISFDDLGRVIKKRIRVTARLNVINIKSRSIILYEPDMQAFITFSDNQPPITTEHDAGEQCITMLAKRIATKTVTGWYTHLMTRMEKGKK